MSKQEKIAQFDPNGVGLNNGHFIGLPFTEEDAEVILFPVPWDVTVSYAAGTSTAPQNILETSTQLDLFDPDIIDAWKMGIYMRPPNQECIRRNQELRPLAMQYIDFLESGGKVEDDPFMQDVLKEVNLACSQLKEWVYRTTKALLEADKLVGLVGGEHSTPLGFLEALAERYDNFGILQIDAHMDLRKAYEGFTYSHASIFYNALAIENMTCLYQVGIRDFCDAEYQLMKQYKKRIHTFFDAELKEALFKKESFDKLCSKIINTLPQKVYISFDIDGLDPKLCPNTGTPVPGGLDFNEALYLIKKVVDSGRTIIGFDLCEVGGLGNEWDGNVGARVLYKLSNLMGKSQGKIYV